MKKKKIILLVLLLISFSFGKEVNVKKLFESIESDIKLEYLYKFNNRSYKEPNWVIKSIYKNTLFAGKEFNINQNILLAVIIQESSFRYNIKHTSVNVRLNGKRHWVRAMGLTGIIYEFHPDLKRIGIYKTDLFSIKQNIRACAYILTKYGIKKDRKKALSRFYGNNNLQYSKRVMRIYKKLSRL